MRLDHLLSKESWCKQLCDAQSAAHNTTQSRNSNEGIAKAMSRQSCEADLGGAIATPYPMVSSSGRSVRAGRRNERFDEVESEISLVKFLVV